MSKCASIALPGGENTEVSEDVVPEKSLAQGQKLEQNFNLFSICGIAVTTGESWIVLGNSLVSPLTQLPSVQADLKGSRNLQWRTSRSTLWLVCSPIPLQFMSSISFYHSIVDSFFYWIVAASIAELASAIPSSATGRCSKVGFTL